MLNRLPFPGLFLFGYHRGKYLVTASGDSNARTPIREFAKIRGTLFCGAYNKDPTTI